MFSFASTKRHIFFFLSFFVLEGYGQNEVNGLVNEFFDTNTYIHGLEQEKFFIHTNKTTYYNGEKVYFKAYVASDLFETPYKRTTNLYINLYDIEGKLLSSDLYFVKNGMVCGEIELGSDFSSGRYHIQAETQWSKNFKDTYSTTIDVLHLDEKTIAKTTIVEKGTKTGPLSIDFYPESDVFLETVKNTFALISKKNDRPIRVQGMVYEEETGEKVAEFESDKQGLGSFKLLCYPGRSYSAVVDLDGEKNSFALPIASEKGITITKGEQTETKIGFKLQTNLKTLTEEAGAYFFAVLHRKGAVKSVVPFQLRKQIFSYNLEFNVKDLYQGLNTLTVFDSANEPVCERFFYNPEGKTVDLEVSKVARLGDSVVLNFDKTKIDKALNLSISVLPKETKVYNNQGNILTSFLLGPYVDSNGLDLAAFFEKEDSLRALDIFLMTQTNMNAFPNRHLNSKKPKYGFEVGLKIKGNVYTTYKKLDECKVMLSSKENSLVLVRSIEDGNQFAFDSLYLRHPSSYKLALLDAKGSIVKAGFTVGHSMNEYVPDSTLLLQERTQVTPEPYQTSTPMFFENTEQRAVEQLEEVVVTERRKQVDYSDLLPNPKVIGDFFNKTYKVDENLYLGNNTAFDVIQDLPGVRTNLIGGATKVRSTRGPKTIVPGVKQSKHEATPHDMAVILDGLRLTDFGVLYDLMASEIEEIKVNAMGAGYGLIGMNGVIIIKTKDAGSNQYGPRRIEKKHVESVTEFGFAPPSTNYENFQLDFPSDLSRAYFGTLDWIPEFTLEPGGKNDLKIRILDQKNIKLVANGFGENGTLVFKEIDLNVN